MYAFMAHLATIPGHLLWLKPQASDEYLVISAPEDFAFNKEDKHTRTRTHTHTQP